MAGSWVVRSEVLSVETVPSVACPGWTQYLSNPFRRNSEHRAMGAVVRQAGGSLTSPVLAGARARVAWSTAGPGCQLEAGGCPGPSSLEACWETWPLEEHLAADREARAGSPREAGAPELSLISQASTGQSVKEA